MNWNELIFFFIFLLIVLLMLFVDLVVISRKSHIVSFREAALWTLVWISFAIGFYFVIRLHADWLHGISSPDDLQELIRKYKHPIHIQGLDFNEALKLYEKNLALEYLTGYLIEYSLSIDNVFVMILIFMAFNVNQKYYKRVLFWGILGAIIMRFIFIFVSSALIQRFEWILYVFGAFLIMTGIRMFLSRNKEGHIEPHKHPLIRFASRHFKIFPRYVGHHFFIRRKTNNKVYLTPLFLVLLMIEFMDVIFAVDSVPAIFSVTKDPYIVFFSNVFAIIGLRSLFFLVMNVINIFHYLKTGLSVLLTFIGVKMLFHHYLEEIGFSTLHSLYVILGIIGLSILASVLFPKKH